MSRMRSQDGFSIVEAMVAALILVIGGLAVMAAVDTAARGTYRAEQSQVQNNRLQEEMEAILELPFDQVALTGVPTHDSDGTHPNWRVQGTDFAVNRNGTGLRAMAYEGGSLEGGGTISGAGVAPGPTEFASGDVHGQIYRYVVWMNDDTCPDTLCPGSQDKKRVIVASVLDQTASGGERLYQELHADMSDPDARFVENPLPPGEGGSGSGGDEDAAWQFWLTDTPCNFDLRQPIVADHSTHNTLGVCDDEMQTGGADGAPDLMFTEGPELDPSLPPEDQPLYDYADDVEPNQSPTEDRGLQMRVPDGQSGCMPLGLGGILESDKQWKIHRWLSPEIPDGYDVVLEGDGTLKLWTQTISGAVHPGRVCAYLFTRQLDILNQPVDTPVLNLDDPTGTDHFVHELESWPSGDWAEIKIPMRFAAVNGGAVHLLPGTRLGLALAVHRNATQPGDGLQFNYDTPSFDSRLEVQTNSALPVFNPG